MKGEKLVCSLILSILNLFLCIGFTLLIFSLDGNLAVLSDVLMIFASSFEINGAIFFKILGGILFGPTAFVGSIFFIIDSICSGVVFVNLKVAVLFISR